jgi:hypothetical protein
LQASPEGDFAEVRKVFIAAHPGGCERSNSKTAKPLSSQATASPSIRHERTLSMFTASTTRGYRGARVVTVAWEQANAERVAASHQSIAVVLDLMDPIGTGRRLVGW